MLYYYYDTVRKGVLKYLFFGGGRGLIFLIFDIDVIRIEHYFLL